MSIFEFFPIHPPFWIPWSKAGTIRSYSAPREGGVLNAIAISCSPCFRSEETLVAVKAFFFLFFYILLPIYHLRLLVALFIPTPFYFFYSAAIFMRLLQNLAFYKFPCSSARTALLKCYSSYFIFIFLRDVCQLVNGRLHCVSGRYLLKKTVAASRDMRHKHLNKNAKIKDPS